MEFRERWKLEQCALEMENKLDFFLEGPPNLYTLVNNNDLDKKEHVDFFRIRKPEVRISKPFLEDLTKFDGKKAESNHPWNFPFLTSGWTTCAKRGTT